MSSLVAASLLTGRDGDVDALVPFLLFLLLASTPVYSCMGSRNLFWGAMKAALLTFMQAHLVLFQYSMMCMMFIETFSKASKIFLFSASSEVSFGFFPFFDPLLLFLLLDDLLLPDLLLLDLLLPFLDFSDLSDLFLPLLFDLPFFVLATFETLVAVSIVFFSIILDDNFFIFSFRFFINFCIALSIKRFLKILGFLKLGLRSGFTYFKASFRSKDCCFRCTRIDCLNSNLSSSDSASYSSWSM